MYLVLKRCFDLIVSFVSLVILSPVFLTIALLIKIDSRGPILFKQRRLGKDNKEFLIFKFRTMRIDSPKDTPTHLLENPEAYITRIGKALRKTSLDELPQLLNILKSEMSFVGPRPALWNQYDLIAHRERYGANNLYPGITGWAQINGRDELPVRIKAELDGEYVRRKNLLFDLQIIFRTFVAVLKKEGVREGIRLK